MKTNFPVDAVRNGESDSFRQPEVVNMLFYFHRYTLSY